MWRIQLFFTVDPVSSAQRRVLPLKVFTFENPTADTPRNHEVFRGNWENQLDPQMLNKILETKQNLSDLLFKSATEERHR